MMERPSSPNALGAAIVEAFREICGVFYPQRFVQVEVDMVESIHND